MKLSVASKAIEPENPQEELEHKTKEKTSEKSGCIISDCGCSEFKPNYFRKKFCQCQHSMNDHVISPGNPSPKPSTTHSTRPRPLQKSGRSCSFRQTISTPPGSFSSDVIPCGEGDACKEGCICTDGFKQFNFKDPGHCCNCYHIHKGNNKMFSRKK
eukprot:TRINITY_DN1490_c0_g1_i1.p1 TRINITY_DN1490_c0_g1~~TRINITY_DN1490_c0_g1_i1.p1  ORF type:complete len:157 (+),score=7.60 TRINITY_DN1490_c0_g1_i1:62-532(+)